MSCNDCIYSDKFNDQCTLSEAEWYEIANDPDRADILEHCGREVTDETT